MADVKVTLLRNDYNPNQRTDIDVEVVNDDGSVSTRTVKGAVQSATHDDGRVTFGILASAHVPPTPTTNYADEVLADSPLVYWRLGDTLGAVATDESGNGRPGTYSGTYTQGAAGATSDGDGSVLLGSTGRVSIDAAAWASGASAFSVEAWFKTAQTGVGWIAHRLSGFDERYAWSLVVSESTLFAYLNQSPTGLSPVGNTATGVNEGNWHHVVATWDGADWALYVDGSHAGTVAAALANSDVAAPIAVGHQPQAWSKTAVTCVDEFAYYDTALSPERIAAHYAAA